MKAWLHIRLVVAFTALLLGCTAPETRRVDDGIAVSGFPFLQDGKITRGEILDRLGQPASYFEDGMVAVYWLRKGEHGELEVVPRNGPAIRLYNHDTLPDLLGPTIGPQRLPKKKSGTSYYNLVLVFDDNDILAEHSLVFIR
jgi:hypothetical protein